jgi:hypothetical protein
MSVIPPDQGPDFITYVDESSKPLSPSSFNHLPIQSPLKPSPQSPSHSPTPTPDDAIYPPFPDHILPNGKSLSLSCPARTSACIDPNQLVHIKLY